NLCLRRPGRTLRVDEDLKRPFVRRGCLLEGGGHRRVDFLVVHDGLLTLKETLAEVEVIKKPLATAVTVGLLLDRLDCLHRIDPWRLESFDGEFDVNGATTQFQPERDTQEVRAISQSDS